MRDRPLFIALRREWFLAFRDGSKRFEWRRYGPRWNEASCQVGRPVVLALGYTRTRLTGVVVSFDRREASEGAARIYGKGTMCAVIGIELHSHRGEDFQAERHRFSGKTKLSTEECNH